MPDDAAMSDPATPPDDAHEQVRERMQLPAMFLVANGAFNLLVALFAAGYAVKEAATPAEALRDDGVKRLASLEQSGAKVPRPSDLDDPERFKRQRVAADGAAAVVLL